MRFSLRQLEVFLATARHENVTRAAQTLAMSQSAASGSLKELESQFDVLLFDRVGKRLQLNDLGLQLRPQAENLLAQARAFEEALAGLEDRGQVHIGATLTIGNYLALNMIADYRRHFPTVGIDLHIANTQTIAAQVAGFELDMGLIEGEYYHPELLTQHWRNDELVVFATPGHALAKTRQLTDDHLKSLNWIVREPGSGTRQTFDRAMHGIITDLNITMALEQTEAIKRAVAVGLGVGCLSRMTLEEEFERGSLVPLKVPSRDFTRELFIITHKDKFRTTALSHWLALCVEQWSSPPLR